LRFYLLVLKFDAPLFRMSKAENSEFGSDFADGTGYCQML